MGFRIYASSNALPHERKSRLGGFLIFAYSLHRFRRREVCQGQEGIVFVVHGVAFSSSHLSFTV